MGHIGSIEEQRFSRSQVTDSSGADQASIVSHRRGIIQHS